MRANYLFTSESVAEGHPDKVCDRISDEIVDLVYREAAKTGINPWGVRIACETLATTNRVVIAGEVRLPPSLMKKDKDGKDVINPSKFKTAARRAIKDIGYEQDGFHWKTAKIDVLLHSQSADIAQGVDNAADQQGDEGAGDQGIMFGYACKETPDLMPAPIYYSHKILQLLATARKTGEGDVGKLGPDAKSQVTVRYVDGKPAEVTSIVLSTQHLDESWDSAEGSRRRRALHPRSPGRPADQPADCNWYINPTGKFVIGGPDGDAGLTGRKIIVDTYGGAAPHGGGAFSGKDTTKVDRSAAYAARYLAKNVVAPASPSAARSRSPTPSALPSRCRSMSTCTAPATRSAKTRSKRRSARPWTCRRPASAATSTSTSRSTPRPRPTAISAARLAVTARSLGAHGSGEGAQGSDQG
jgi:S-adenosylmethionine synthetase